MLVFLAAVFFGTAPAGTVQAQAALPLRISIDGIVAETDAAPFIDANSRTMVPVRFISEALGSFVGWDETTQQVRISRPGTLVELQIGQQAALVNGTAQEMDTTAVLTGGRTMVPLRFLAETFGLKVAWEQEQRTVAIKTALTQSPSPPSAQPAAALRYCTVSGSLVNIRSGAGTDYSRIAQVTRGTRLTILAEQDAWYLVEVPSGPTGWIAGWLVELPDAVPTGGIRLRDYHAAPVDVTRSALIMKNRVNVRSAPALASPVITQVNLGQRLPVTGEENGWFAVDLPGGQRGWIAGWLAAIRYDAVNRAAAADTGRTTGLVSRWNAGGQAMVSDLPLLTGMDVEQSGSGVLLKVSAAAPLALPASFRLENPSRLVFDFTAQLANQTEAPILQANHGPVSLFRVSRFNERTVRIVADLQGPASYAISQAPDSMTVIIQIKPVDPARQVIVIDPGHGALQPWGDSDPGAIGPAGLREREVVRSISLELGNILLNEGFTVIYTRKGNTELTLQERALVADISGAELLVSIHVNASTNRAIAGSMTFYHAPWGTRLEPQIQARRALAGFIQAELLNRLQREDRGVQEADFMVLRSSPVPAALVEVAFISNPEEERLLADPAFQRRAAEAVALGIKRYLVSR
jgi:N-acetylmuramoyl-L-alanine amidase